MTKDDLLRRWLRRLVAAPRRATTAPHASAILGRLVSVATDGHGLIGKLQRLAQGRAQFGAHEVETICAGAIACGREAVAILEQLTGDRERHMSTLLDRLADGVARTLQGSVSEDVTARFGPGAEYWDPSRDSRVVMKPLSANVSSMVEILASGEIQTRLPDEADIDAILVRGTWGLFPPAWERSEPVDLIRVSRHVPHHIVVAEIASKAHMHLAGVDGRVVTVDVPGWMRDQPCLTRAQASALAAYSIRLEEEFGGPHEADWVLDRSERILILRTQLGLKAARQEDALRQDPLVHRTLAALALLQPLTIAPPSPGRDSSGECVTLHDVLCSTYERGMQMAGAGDDPPASWPGRTNQRAS